MLIISKLYGEEYNFDDGVEEDITLVAKWIKGSFNEEKIENDNNFHFH